MLSVQHRLPPLHRASKRRARLQVDAVLAVLLAQKAVSGGNPVIREFQDGRQVSEHHIIEHLEARWRGQEHVDPLLAYFRQRIAHGKVPVGRIVAAEEEEGELQPAGD